jgi:hypothetical protein
MKSLSILTAVAVVSALMMAALPAQAASKYRAARHASPARTYDGLWSVSIRTQEGPCDPAYRYPARIIGGRIVQADNDFSYQISGAVVASGGIAVTVSKGGQNAVGYGKLHGSTGGGRWSASGNTCWGTWTALRRASN